MGEIQGLQFAFCVLLRYAFVHMPCIMHKACRAIVLFCCTDRAHTPRDALFLHIYRGDGAMRDVPFYGDPYSFFVRAQGRRVLFSKVLRWFRLKRDRMFIVDEVHNKVEPG